MQVVSTDHLNLKQSGIVSKGHGCLRFMTLDIEMSLK